MDDAFADTFHALLGPFTASVYMQLCRYSNKAQEAWPGIDRLAERSGISRRQVIRSIDALEKHALIGIIRGKGKDGRQAVNVYVLLDKSQWLRVPTRHPAPGATQSPGRVPGPGATQALEGDTWKETQNEGGELPVDKPAQLAAIRSELEAKGILKRRP